MLINSHLYCSRSVNYVAGSSSFRDDGAGAPTVPRARVACALIQAAGDQFEKHVVCARVFNGLRI